mgnify:CR=1 FL=1|jgi:hypothetical protein
MSSQNCTSCKVGYTLQNNTCILVDACSIILGCQRCAFNGVKYYCLDCRTKYTNFGAGCYLCPRNCTSCVQNKTNLY